MTTQQKIREAFEKHINEMLKLYGDDPDMRKAIKRERAYSFDMFYKGYLALLNELEIVSVSMDRKHLYRLPEGVEKP